MAFPPDCGKRFSWLLSSGDGKVSYTAPCGDGLFGICTGPDRERAMQRATEAYQLVRQAWNELMDQENIRQDWPVTRLHRDAVEAYEARFEALPKHLVTLQLQDHIEKVWANVLEGTCLIDVLDQAAKAYGAGGIPTPKPPPPPPKPMNPVTGLAIGAGIALVIAAVVLRR